MKMEIKITLRFNLTLVWMAIIQVHLMPVRMYSKGEHSSIASGSTKLHSQSYKELERVSELKYYE